jgi:predicted Zn finger-like uncharacterized protein
MIVKCSNCNTKFRVNSADIGENGRMVSCSVCEYEWLYIPIKNTSEKKDDVYHEEYIDKKYSDILKGNSNMYVPVLFNFLLIVIFVLGVAYIERQFFIKQHSVIERFYKIFDYHNVDGLELKILKPLKTYFTQDTSDKKVQYELPISITNNTNKPKFLQIIEIVGYNIDADKITTLSLDIKRDIPAHSELKMQIKTIKLDEEIDYIIAKMGNKHDAKNFDFDKAIKTII